MNNEKYSEIKINIGCGGRPLQGYINIDSDDLTELRRRYPDQNFPEKLKIYNYNIFNLPFDDNSVSEVRADSLIEHLSFVEEPQFFFEMKRVIKPGGQFHFSTTNFEEIVKLWLEAKDDWKDFFRNDNEAIDTQHWFGQYSYSAENRWGYLCAMIFGSQNGAGQFHKNCYSISKIRSILKRIEFNEIKISQFRWKDDRDPMIDVFAMKPDK